MNKYFFLFSLFLSSSLFALDETSPRLQQIYNELYYIRGYTFDMIYNLLPDILDALYSGIDHSPSIYEELRSILEAIEDLKEDGDDGSGDISHIYESVLDSLSSIDDNLDNLVSSNSNEDFSYVRGSYRQLGNDFGSSFASITYANAPSKSVSGSLSSFLGGALSDIGNILGGIRRDMYNEISLQREAFFDGSFNFGYLLDPTYAQLTSLTDFPVSRNLRFSGTRSGLGAMLFGHLCNISDMLSSSTFIQASILSKLSSTNSTNSSDSADSSDFDGFTWLKDNETLHTTWFKTFSSSSISNNAIETADNFFDYSANAFVAFNKQLDQISSSLSKRDTSSDQSSLQTAVDSISIDSVSSAFEFDDWEFVSNYKGYFQSSKFTSVFEGNGCPEVITIKLPSVFGIATKVVSVDVSDISGFLDVSRACFTIFYYVLVVSIVVFIFRLFFPLVLKFNSCLSRVLYWQ